MPWRSSWDLLLKPFSLVNIQWNLHSPHLVNPRSRWWPYPTEKGERVRLLRCWALLSFLFSYWPFWACVQLRLRECGVRVRQKWIGISLNVLTLLCVESWNAWPCDRQTTEWCSHRETEWSKSWVLNWKWCSHSEYLSTRWRLFFFTDERRGGTVSVLSQRRC